MVKCSTHFCGVMYNNLKHKPCTRHVTFVACCCRILQEML